MLREAQKNAVRQRSSRIKKTVIFFFILLLLILGFYFVCKIKTVNVIGCKHYTEEQMIKKIITDRFEENSVLLYLKSKYFTNRKIPFIEKYDIEMVSPNTININVYEKVITGCIEHMGEILYFDKDGIIVESSKKKIDYVPYIVGLKYDKLVLNEKLEIQKEELFDTILSITQLIKKYQLDIEKVSFDLNSNVTLLSGKIRIFLGKNEAYDNQIANLQSILPKMEGLSGVLDMQSMKEGKNKFVFKQDK